LIADNDLFQLEIGALKIANGEGPIRVLHVDDDPSLLEISKKLLMDIDGSFEIDQAGCVDVGLSKLSTGHYDVVVSDYEMPQKDGLQFLTKLREQKNDIPFILFTGKGREEVAIKALNLGADGYYDKQGSPETVYGELAYGIRASFGRKNAEKLLKSSQEELKAIVLNAPLGIATSNSKMQFLSANEAFCRITGYSEDELQKRTFRAITYPEDVEVSSAGMEELISGHIPFFSQEKRYVRKDGSIIDGKIIVSLIRRNEGKPVLFIAELEDITEHKQAEAELRGTFEVLEQVGEGIDAGLAVIGKDYRVIWANKLLMNLGVTPNKKCYQTFNHSENVCVDCGAKRIFEQNLPLDVHEFKTINSKGETIWVELRVTPLKDKDGKTTAALELAVPITERKKVEADLTFALNSLSKSLGNIEELNDKLRVVGSLTMHDIRNKLSIVTGYAYILKKKYSDKADIVNGLGKMEQAVKDSMNIIAVAKIYEQIGLEELIYIDVEKNLNEAIALSSGLLPTIFNECHGLKVLADSFLSQMFYNFIEDTKKYGKKATMIRVYFEKAASGELRLIYMDDGVGISAENKLRIFAKGFSTGGSTGFGLFLIKKMVEVYGWEIQEIGEPGKGVKFIITIPKINKNGKEVFQIG